MAAAFQVEAQMDVLPEVRLQLGELVGTPTPPRNFG